MSEKESHVVPLYTSKGALHGIYLSPEIWERVARKVTPILETTLEAMYPTTREEPMDEWHEFKDYWDFKYPFTAEVTCKECGQHTEDWEHDAEKPFLLKSASLSGLVIFTCTKCQSTIRKKHFKDHICYEISPGQCGLS